MPETHDLSPQMMLNILSGLFPVIGAANVGTRAGTALGNNYNDVKKEQARAPRSKGGLPDMSQYEALAKQQPGDQFSTANFVTGISPPTARPAAAKPVMAQTAPVSNGSAAGALTALQGAPSGSIPAEKVGAKPDLNALIDQSISDTMQPITQTGPQKLTTSEDEGKLKELLSPKKPTNYKTGSEGDVKGVSGLKRFIGYSQTGDWRKADKDEMAYQIMRARYDRGDQEYTPQELEQLKILTARSSADEAAQRKFGENQAEATRRSQDLLREQRLRNKGQLEEAQARLAQQLGGDSKLAAALLERYPDLFGAEQIKSATGMDANPQVLQTITQGRLPAEKEADPTKEILAQFLAQRLNIKPQGAAPAGAPAQKGGSLELRALGGK